MAEKPIYCVLLAYVMIGILRPSLLRRVLPQMQAPCAAITREAPPGSWRYLPARQGKGSPASGAPRVLWSLRFSRRIRTPAMLPICLTGRFDDHQ